LPERGRASSQPSLSSCRQTCKAVERLISWRAIRLRIDGKREPTASVPASMAAR
jgi:hypothetical protein